MAVFLLECTLPLPNFCLGSRPRRPRSPLHCRRCDRQKRVAESLTCRRCCIPFVPFQRNRLGGGSRRRSIADCPWWSCANRSQKRSRPDESSRDRSRLSRKRNNSASPTPFRTGIAHFPHCQVFQPKKHKNLLQCFYRTSKMMAASELISIVRL